VEIKGEKEMAWEFLKKIEEWGLNPNFWMSEEYFIHAGFEEVHERDYVGIRDKDKKWIFPIINSENKSMCLFTMLGFWADFMKENNLDYAFNGFSLLDYNYIYDPEHFISLYTTGKKWRLWNKNIKRFTDTIPNYRLLKYKKTKPDLAVLIKWLENREEDEIHDDTVLINYFTNPLSDNCKGVFLDDELIGINIWDENYKYINYRYTFHDPGHPFLSYYLRWRFYLDMIPKKKLVNDGGTLGKDSLKFFKDHLNPVKVHKIYSLNWEKGR